MAWINDASKPFLLALAREALEVAAGAEHPAGAGEHDGPDRRVFVTAHHRVHEVTRQVNIERVGRAQSN